MVGSLPVIRALRARLLTLSVTQSAAVAIGVSGRTITRASGSWLTDGFSVGQEIACSAFAKAENNGKRRVVQSVSDAAIICTAASPAFATESSTVGPVISVPLPSTVIWEGTQADPSPDWPYVVERYLPGPSTITTLSTAGEVELTPQYQCVFFTASGAGVDALAAYADAMQSHFRIATTLSLSTGDTVRVRGDTGPFRAPVNLLSSVGWSAVSVTIPLRIYTPNQ